MKEQLFFINIVSVSNSFFQIKNKKHKQKRKRIKNN